MKRHLNYYLKIFFALILPVAAFAQTATDEVEMADVLRSNGKIYVVVAVLLIIFIGLMIYLISIDRKVQQLEKAKKMS